MVNSTFLAFRRCTGVLWLAGIVTACGSGERTRPSGRPDSASLASRPSSSRTEAAPAAPVWVAKPILIQPDPKAVHADSVARTLADGQPDSSADPRAPAKRTRKRAPGERRYELSPADSARWPVKGPAPLPGSLLPEHRIVAFYGNPKSTRMGILGQLPP